MSDWLAKDWVNGFIAALRVAPALEDVIVTGAPVPSDRWKSEHIMVTSVAPGTTEPRSIGPLDAPNQEESWTVDGMVVVRRLQQGEGTGDDTATVARDRCFDLYAALEDAIRADFRMGTETRPGVVNIRITRQLDQGVVDKYRVAAITFAVIVTARR